MDDYGACSKTKNVFDLKLETIFSFVPRSHLSFDLNLTNVIFEKCFFGCIHPNNLFSFLKRRQKRIDTGCSKSIRHIFWVTKQYVNIHKKISFFQERLCTTQRFFLVYTNPKPSRRIEKHIISRMLGCSAFSIQKKVECVTWYNEINSITQTQHIYHEKHH